MQRMLIVDDERDICELLEEFFKTKGFSVLSAFSGEEALDQLGQNPPDVILLDILLPGISGLEVLRRIKERHPHTRVIMVTSLDRVELKTEALEHGAADFVLKPFDFSLTTWAAALPDRPSSPA